MLGVEWSCTWIAIFLILIGSGGNWLCICVFARKRFRQSVLTPFFVALLLADSIYLTFRVIKIFYYQETLFKKLANDLSCSTSILIQIYGKFTQYAPQLLIPLCHFELYIRFSLLLMSFLAMQRAWDMCNTSFRLMIPGSSARLCTFVLIALAFILAYIFEFFGLSIFCSDHLSSTVAYEWFDYIRTKLSNETHVFIGFMHNQSADETEINCVLDYNQTFCSHERRLGIVSHYFDMHQRPIVELIHKIQLATVGVKIPRNELRLKYHFHTCLFRIESNRFLRLYDVLYSRFIGLNRYTFILVLGSIIPSVITVIGNILSLRWIVTIRNSVRGQSHACRRRTEETRHVVIIITVECLLAIVNSWLVDIILSIYFCGHSLAIGDDCPQFLNRFRSLMALFDMINSMSNIILYCFAGTRFRHELRRMLKAWFDAINKRIPYTIHCEWKKQREPIPTREEDRQTTQSSIPQPNQFNRSTTRREYIQLRPVIYPTNFE